MCRNDLADIQALFGEIIRLENIADKNDDCSFFILSFLCRALKDLDDKKPGEWEDDDDNDYKTDETDVSLPAVVVKQSTREFYKQHQPKVY